MWRQQTADQSFTYEWGLRDRERKGARDGVETEVERERGGETEREGDRERGG